ncbi:LOW QUALITY PROTEIN: dmX-like protein 2 [Lytechinus variegatus]|uniref:LOW QUALITY PROTEIN: dmX-like protein 2 n=1 Tax=Lytechinus variegatus TaxID=7654 RepID=UPI001BB1F2A6|nr:LOW QUALITY PROTEIN: dmX-like protein 2 [Lytechinus variegatus]
MNRHQVLTGAVNPGDCCFAVGYVDGVPFTAYASGCDIVILACDFQRTQIIPGEKHGNIQVGCIDCSSENGKIAASYANQVYIFEPSPVAQKKNSNHKLEYQWEETGSFKIDSLVSNLSWNQDGTKLLTGSNAIQLWACEKVVTIEVSDAGEETTQSVDKPIPGYTWQCSWQCKTATAIYHLKFSADGQFFASAGKADRLVKIWYQNRHPSIGSGTNKDQVQDDSNKSDSYSFIYIAHPRAVTGFSWRKTSKYMPSGAVANVLVTSCRDNICRLWCETLLPDTTSSKGTSKYSKHVENTKEHTNTATKRPNFSLNIKPRKKKKQVEHAIPLPSQKKEHELHRYYHGKVQRNGLGGNPLHFHIAATINPNTDIPLLPAIGTMTKGSAPNFVVNWLNNKELQFTLAAETLLQTGQESRNSTSTIPVPAEEEEEEVDGDTSLDQGTTSDDDDIPTVKIHVENSSPELTKEANSGSPRIPPARPDSLNTSPFSPPSSTLPNTDMLDIEEKRAIEKKFQGLIKEWHCNPDMLYSIHPIDGSFLLWLVDWMDEHIPGVHRQPQVSFSCRIPHAFPTFDATTLCNNLVLYRSNLTMDPRASKRLADPLSPVDASGMTPSYSFARYLSQVPSGVDIFAFTPKVSMLSKHANGSLNQWEISFQEGSKFQTVLNVSHVARSCGHRFSLNHLACHPILPLLLTTSHHNIPKVEVDFDVATSRSRRTSMISRRASIVKRASMVIEATGQNTVTPGAINLFGKNILSESEHNRLMTLYNSTVEGSTQDFNEKDDIILPDELMEQVNAELNWPDMSAPTGLCSELILWRVFNVGPLGKGGGVMELARINSPFVSAFSHIAWMPSLLPSSCLGPISNSPSACFIASDGYSLRLFQAVIDARSLLNEITPSSNQLEGYLSSSSPVTAFLLQNTDENNEDDDEKKGQKCPQVISLQSTSRPGCIIELDTLNDAKQNWQNVQLMHVYQQQFISGPDSKIRQSRSSHRLGSTSSSPLHTSLFEERFFLVVVERKLTGESMVHMWYIRLERDVSKGGVPCDGLESDEESQLDDDIPDDSSSDFSDGEASNQYDSEKSTNQVSSKIKTFSRKVCSQKLDLPIGVEVVSATPAAGHLSSSSIYPACVAPYLFATACSDGKLRFWTCNMSSADGSQSSFDQGEDLPGEIDPSKEDDFTRADYSWEEWKLLVQVDTDSSLGVAGLPVALSSAYNGRIACIFRTNPHHEHHNADLIPLKLAIYECESTGGSEWMIEEAIDLGMLDLKAWMRQEDDEVPESEVINYKTMKRSSKVNDFLHISASPNSSCGSPPSPENLPAVLTQRKRSILKAKQSQYDDAGLPVQLSWVSKEDGTHILTVGMGSKVVVFAPVSTEFVEAGANGIPDDIITQQTGLQRVATMGETTSLRWLPLRTVNLSSVDGIAPHSKMLSWVRAGILVVGLQNEMHVYSQWREENWRSRRRKYRRPVPSTTDTLVSQKSTNSSLSVNLQTIPMSRTDREKSYNDMSELLRESAMMSSIQEQEDDKDDIKQDFGLFEISYSTCPVLPQYHPKQLMGLMSSGKIRRVKAILVHLVNCIAGEDAVKQSLLASVTQDRDQDDEEAKFRRSLRTLSVAHSPVESSVLDDSGPKLDYIELVSVPPLPLYRLTSADTPVTVTTAPAVTRATRTTSILSPPDEITTVDAQDYTQLFSTSLQAFPSSLDAEGELRSPQDGAASLASKLKDPTYFTVGQAQLLTNYLTHMHLPGLSSLDQMHLLALADTIASTKTEITPHSGGSAGTVIAREGAGYATVDDSDSSHAGETLDECGLRFLLAMRFHICLTKSLPRHQQVQLKHQGIGSCHFAWAFHSEAEEELLSLIPGIQKGTPTWTELRSVGVGWWVRNNTTLRRCIEKVAKSQFQAEKNPLDSALFYLAMKKKNVLWGLFRSIKDQRMTTFFRNDFNTDRWRKAALKNAFALLGRQRFEHAAAFFLLAGSLKDAVEVCMNNLEDVQLAMVVTRLYEDEEMPAKQKEILRYKILAQDEKGEKLVQNQPHPDPFLRSIAFWMLKDYPASLKTLLQSSTQEKNGPKNNLPNGQATGDHEDQKGERANPDVFNFYNYLRTHPLLLRRQLADATKGSQGAGLLISGASVGGFGKTSAGGDQLVKDEITPEERTLFFTTAHAHLSAGCPLLALDVLAKIPKVRTKTKEDDNKMVESKSVDSLPSSNMISTGTIDTGFSSASYTGSSSKDSGMGMDWGAPVSSQLTNGHKSDSGLEMDWGAPVGGKLEEEELTLDWGGDDDDDEEDEDKKLEQKKSSSSDDTNNGTLMNGADDSASSKNESSVVSDDNESGIDIIAQQLKFICCLKIMMEELRTLATGFEVDGGQLRYQLYIWLEQQVETLQQLCNYGSPVTTKNIVEDDDMDEQDGGETDGGQGTLYEQLQAKRLDLEEKRQRAVRRKRWLRDNHHLLRTLVSYTMLYGANGGGLASVAMELVLLVQELQQERIVQQLSSPLPIPTTLPLMSASIANCKTVVTDPILYLRLHIHSVLRTILDFTAPPSPNHHSPIISVVHALSAALSACIYQSLCDSDSFSATIGKSKVTGMDAYTPGSRSHVMFRVGHLVSVGRKRSRHQSQEQNNLSITSPPGKWPGVATYQALLASERDDDIPSPNIQLCEGLIAVYMSLLLHALSNNNANELFRLVAHDLNGKTWASVFGGGAKVVAQAKLLASHSSSSGDEALAKQRDRLALRLMGKASRGGKSAAATDDKPVLRELFVPPETSLRDYFLVKPYIPPSQAGTDYDSNASDSSDDEDLDAYMDDDYDDTGPFSSRASRRKRNVPLPGETEHSDANSYSWCLMRYAVIKLVISKIQSFLPIAGIELAELPVASAILHSVLKLLEQWQQACMRKLDLFARPPPDFISETSGSSMTGLSGPAILRYKGLLDPANTPFRSDSKATLPAKRLWNFLVRQEIIQDIFIQYIFKKGNVMEDMPDSSMRSPSRSTGSLPQAASQAKLIHKEQEKISAFCFNQADWKNISMNGEFQSNPSSVVVSTHRGLLELDISLLLTPDNSYWLDDEDGGDQQMKGKNSQMEDEFLMVQPTSIPSPRLSKSSSVPFIQLPPGGFNPAFPSDSTPAQTGRSTHVITHRPLYHIRKLSAHPNLPYYLSGSNDGSVHMWEWGHSQKLYTHRTPGQFPKVTQINFNDQGNKFGVCDDGGQLALWQVGMNSPAATKPFWSMACHNKTAYDFAFLGSSSLLVTSGVSTDSKNVCLWDTLLPFRKCMVHGFSCHEGGVPSVLYCPRQQTIIAGSKKGEVSIFDIRQRKLRHTFQAHESSIKTLCVDPMEEFFVTGSAEGNIKVWSLSVHSLLHYFPGQHTRGNFFRQSGNGVVQLALLPPNNLYSCGADGTMKWRSLNISSNPTSTRSTSSIHA